MDRSGCFGEEFAPWSNGLMDDFRSGLYRPVLSEVLAREIGGAPEPVRQVYRELIESDAEYLTTGVQAAQLQEAYERRNVLTSRYRDNLLHIALATAANVDVLVSWNFRHIVHMDKIRMFNAVNLELGYKPLVIHTPREVMSHDAR